MLKANRASKTEVNRCVFQTIKAVRINRRYKSLVLSDDFPCKPRALRPPPGPRGNPHDGRRDVTQHGPLSRLSRAVTWAALSLRGTFPSKMGKKEYGI